MQDDKEFFENRLNLFMQDGWRDLVDELNNFSASIDSVLSIDNEKDLFYIRGQLSIINMLVNMEESTKLAMENFEESPSE